MLLLAADPLKQCILCSAGGVCQLENTKVLPGNILITVYVIHDYVYVIMFFLLPFGNAGWRGRDRREKSQGHQKGLQGTGVTG